MEEEGEGPGGSTGNRERLQTSAPLGPLSSASTRLSSQHQNACSKMQSPGGTVLVKPFEPRDQSLRVRSSCEDLEEGEEEAEGMEKWLVFLGVVVLTRVVDGLRCYSCTFSFNEHYDLDRLDGWCANESLILFDSAETSKICASWETFCVTAVTTILKAFTSVSRGCGERCSELCESVGYGQDQVNCDDCCEDDLCNSNFSVQYYMDMMSRQYTSWVDPLPGEIEFNRKNNIRFPY